MIIITTGKTIPIKNINKKVIGQEVLNLSHNSITADCAGHEYK